ncbi:MAG: tRNA pseudouridine(55) synthase TruB [Candidatus Woesearchaeota archaeon]
MSNIEPLSRFCQRYDISIPDNLRIIRVYDRVFFVPDEYAKYLSKFQPKYIGTCLGKIQQEQFEPTRYFLDKFCQNLPKVSISQKQSLFFVYGKDVLDFQAPVEEHTFVRVYHQDTVLGLAKVSQKHLTPIYDIGQSLRNEMGTKR